MDLGIHGKYALVTGGSHGIGLAVAQALAAEGCHVALCSRDPRRLKAALKTLKKTRVKTIAVTADVLTPGDIDRVTGAVEKAWKKIDILINNVGGGGRWGSESVENTPESVWKEVYDKNAMAAVRFTRWAIPHMRGQKWGRVVTVSSVHGKEGGGRPWFNMAKAAEISLMKSLSIREDLARDGLTFNSVAPGGIMIPDTGWDRERKKNPKAFKRMLHQYFPLGRLGTPEEVAAAVVFLCSKKAALLNGACVTVDGGESRSF